MIAYLKGTVIFNDGESIVLETGGIGYEVFCSGSVLKKVQLHATAELYTYLLVKEDGVSLFGFSSVQEKQLFLKLLSVSGVGAKTAIGILATLSAEELWNAVYTADTKKLSSVKGLGKKTAEKIILELHGKISAQEVLGDELNERRTDVPKEYEEAVSALTGLGFKKGESEKLVQSALDLGAKSVEEIIRLALKNTL